MSADPALTAYYAQRAAEYERVYTKPERQPDLALLRKRIPMLLADRVVYEVACGTGYWTQFIAPAARSIFATDFNEDVLAVARTKPVPEDRVFYATADAFNLPPPPVRCDAGFAGFWWSHLRRDEIENFLQGFFTRLRPGARFVFVDNRYVEGSSLPITRTDAEGNTFQERQLDDGTRHEVLKNFPDAAAVRSLLEPYVKRSSVESLPYYWLAWGDAR
jgi:demethylmenaquinone methyltransferase/2-methoxy-6-polyprenyl-1,4-benzoquinol methylase